MRLLHLHPGPDTAGQSMAAKAVLEASGDEVRVFVHNQHPFGYSTALLWDDAAVRESWTWADVVVLHNDPSLYQPGFEARVIVHHHGTRFRSNPTQVYAAGAAIGARQVVSTIDLLLSVPDGKPADWFPQVIDMEAMRAVRPTYGPADKIRVAHAPTNRMVKGTRHVTRAMRTLKNEADYILIQRQSWRRCLELKASADVFVDQLNLGYGNNAVEAWAMGLPVIAGAPEPILERMRAEWGDLPFLASTPDRLTDDIRALIESADVRAEWAGKGLAHVEKYHAPDAWAERARAVYSVEPVEAAA